MNGCNLSRGRTGGPRWAAVLWIAVAAGGLVRAADPTTAAGPEPRVAAAICTSADGALLSRESEGKDWLSVAPKGAVSSRDVLLALPGLKAVVESNGVNLTLIGNMRQLAPGATPVLESEVVLHDGRAYDLDFTLNKGRVVVANTKEKGPARVWVRLPGFSWQVTLQDPGARVGLEVYGRWPLGVRFSKEPKPGEEPTKVVALLMLKGKADLQTDSHSYELAAPPGPALMEWDSVAGEAGGPRSMKALPPWADSNLAVPAEGKAVEEVVDAYQAALKKAAAPGPALQALLDDAGREKDKHRAALTREFAVLGLNALDDVARVVEALSDPHSADVRDAAVLALRNWIGGAPGRDQDLYRLLIIQFHDGERQAETILDLLHSPFDPDKPVTYEALIHLLQHPSLAVRHLARWHLYRLAQAGKDIPFDAAGSDEERDKAVKAWKDLIPSGEMPKEKK